MNRCRDILFFLFLFLTGSLLAQVPTAEAVLDKKSIRIGEQCTLHLFVRYTEGSQKTDVQWPVINDSLAAHIEVLGNDTITTTLVDRYSVMYEQKCSWVITSFDSGTWVIPPVSFIVNKDIASTNAVELYVNTVPVDTTQPIKDIANIYDVPGPPPLPEIERSMMWWWIGGGLILLTAIILFLVLRKKKAEPVAPVQTGHVLLPHEIILQQLHEMAAKKPWQDGNLKGHYTNLSELMRGWVVERFRFHAREMTTYEIMMRLRRAPDSGNKTSELEHVLKTADLVKFAKSSPDDYVNEKCIEHAIQFVQSTSFTTVHIPPPPNTYNS